LPPKPTSRAYEYKALTNPRFRDRRQRAHGKVEDIAVLALFPCSEGARHIQGTAIAVDGGATVGYY